MQIEVSYQTPVAFPAVTICNQNRVSCYNLLRETLNTLPENETINVPKIVKDTYPLLYLYNVSYCGLDGMTCIGPYEIYYRHYSSFNVIPKNVLIEMDLCLDCYFIYDTAMSYVCEENSHWNDALKFVWNFTQCSLPNKVYKINIC